jgi:hypothetical protein
MNTGYDSPLEDFSIENFEEAWTTEVFRRSGTEDAKTWQKIHTAGLGPVLSDARDEGTGTNSGALSDVGIARGAIMEQLRQFLQHIEGVSGSSQAQILSTESSVHPMPTMPKADCTGSNKQFWLRIELRSLRLREWEGKDIKTSMSFHGTRGCCLPFIFADGYLKIGPRALQDFREMRCRGVSTTPHFDVATRHAYPESLPVVSPGSSRAGLDLAERIRPSWAKKTCDSKAAFQSDS